MNKIFGIGLSRTGTSSLTKALQMLGYKAIHYPRLKDIFELAKKYDAMTDTTVCVCFEELDKRFPNSKFILTTRDIKSWLKSCKWFFSLEKALNSPRYKRTGNLLGKQQIYLREKLYGSKFFSEKYKQYFINYHNKVKDYFKDRLLIMNIGKGDGFNKLCPFLEKPILQKHFPHLHNRGVKNATQR